MIGIYLQRDRFGKIQTENAQNGFSVYHMAADAKVDVVGVFVRNVHKVFDVLRQTQFDVYCLHNTYPPLVRFSAYADTSIALFDEGFKHIFIIYEYLIAPL